MRLYQAGTDDASKEPESMPEYLSTFHQSLVDPDTFSITWELVPGRGAFERAQKTLLTRAEQAASRCRDSTLSGT